MWCVRVRGAGAGDGKVKDLKICPPGNIADGSSSQLLNPIIFRLSKPCTDRKVGSRDVWCSAGVMLRPRGVGGGTEKSGQLPDDDEEVRSRD